MYKMNIERKDDWHISYHISHLTILASPFSFATFE